MRWMLSIYLFLILIFPVYVHAQEFNAGFVQGLWYSKEKVFAEKPIRIYVAIRNNTGADLTGTVEFFDNGTLIERNDVSALNGRIIESWADWNPSYGEHTLSATLSRTELNQVGTSTKAVTVTSALAEEFLFVDYDTDNDGIGNTDDVDDDGDGISDAVEETNGTDPLVFDAPKTEKAETEEISEDEDLKADLAEENEKSNAVTDNSVPSEGFEQYLSPGTAQSVLSGITQIIQNSKRNLDEYRDKRAQELEKKNKPPEEVEVNSDGFGEITRTKENKGPELQKPEIKEGGFFDTVFSILGSVLSAVYTGILSVLSFLLGKPALMQFTLLVLILFILYKTAQRMSRRPQ